MIIPHRIGEGIEGRQVTPDAVANDRALQLAHQREFV